MCEADCVMNIQKRLSARVHTAVVACRTCDETLDPCLEHTECCALSEATLVHYAVVRAVVDGIRLADPGVTTEPAGLTSTQARPADIFTTAVVPGRSTALDVCVASSNSAAAGGDAAEAAFQCLRRRYRAERAELAAAGTAFRPL